MQSVLRGTLLAVLLGLVLSGVALAIPQARASSASITQMSQPSADVRALLIQLLGVYALSFGLVRALFWPGARVQRTASD